MMSYAADLLQDLRYAVRSMRQAPGFTLVAVLSAALGIGACATIFGIANFALFSRLPVRDADRLISLSGASRGGAGKSLSYPAYEELTRARSFQGMAAYFPVVTGGFAPASGNSGQPPSRHWGALVTENFFDVVQPAFTAGGGFAAARRDRAIVLSHSLWLSRFGEDRSIVGRTVLWNGKPVTVAGVTAPGFRGTEPLLYSEFWIPFRMIDDVATLSRDSGRFEHGNQWLYAIGRLRDGATYESAQAELTVASQRFEKTHTANTGRSFFLQPAGVVTPLVKQLMTVFFLLLAAVTALVLLVASANVANLLLARGTQREKEIATRLAVGASRGRLVRQLLTESLLLGLLGGLGGCALAYWAAGNLGKFELPMPVPIDISVLLDYRLLLFSTAAALVTGLLFGAVPAWRASGADLSQGMKLRRHRRFGLRNVLVVAQVSISMVLLVCSGLFLRSLGAAQSLDIGMSERDVLLLAVDPTIQQYDAARTRQFLVQLRDRVQTLAAVEAAAYTQYMPLSMGGSSSEFSLPGEQRRFPADIFTISPGYFATVGVPIRHGEDFAGKPGDVGSVLINEHGARLAFGTVNAVGRLLDYDGGPKRVIGVVANGKSRTLGEEQRTALYRPLYESSNRGDGFLGMTLAVRTKGDPARLTEAVRAEIRALDPAMPIFDVRTMRTHLERAMILPRLAALMFGLCGAVALVISTIGLYGVVSFSVAQRTREIGIRMALGAERGHVLGWILRGGMALAGLGIVLGTAAALGVSRVTASLLYGVSTTDVLTFTATPLFLLAVVLVACWIPARRAATLDPVKTLRAE